MYFLTINSEDEILHVYVYTNIYVIRFGFQNNA